MGKKLIILGADFSADSITEEIWYQTENTVWTAMRKITAGTAAKRATQTMKRFWPFAENRSATS